MTKLEDELRLGADGYLQKLLERKTLLDHLWSGFKIGCILLAMFLSIYSLYLVKQKDQVKTQAQFAQLETIMKQKFLDLYKQTAKLKANQTKVVMMEPMPKRTPVLFDCYRVTSLKRPAIVTYDGCFVDSTKGGMSAFNGIFTVVDAGVYQITFTAKYVSSNKGRFGAWSDIYVNETVIADSQREYNGPKGKGANNPGGSGQTESSTHTILVHYQLNIGDQVKVQFNKDGNSYIHSDSDHDVHFTGLKVADPLPN